MPDIRTPAARSTDPHTSHQAAEDITRSGARAKQQQLVLDAALRWPGLTSAELAVMSGHDRYMVARRLPELDPWVRKASARKCGITNKTCVTWLPGQLTR